MTKVRFAFIALKKYIDSLLLNAAGELSDLNIIYDHYKALNTYIDSLLLDIVDLSKNDDNVRFYQLCFINCTLRSIKERLSELEQLIDSEEEAHEEALKEAREE